MHYDLIVVGGGMAGATLAGALASAGRRVLVLERELAFRDRVRGEGMHPWGVAEARKLGIYDGLLASCAHETPWWRTAVAGAPAVVERNLVETTPHRAGSLNFYHPEMQEHLLSGAVEAGAEVQRGAVVEGVHPGTTRVSVRLADGGVASHTARLVVGADGRNSQVRGWAGFSIQHAPDRLAIAGVLLRGVKLPEDGVHYLVHPGLVSCHGIGYQ